MPYGNCLFCKSEANVEEGHAGDNTLVECPNCGRFTISGSAYADFPGRKCTPQKAAILSHAVFKMQDRDALPWLDSYTIDALLKSGKPPGHIEQAENLILFIGRELDRRANPGGKIVKVNYSLFRAAIGAVRAEDAEFIIDELYRDGLVGRAEGEAQYGGREYTECPAIGLTFRGWSRYGELMKIGTTARIAFMAMQYKDDVLDMMFDNCFSPAVEDTGFELRRLDKHPKAGVIDNLLRAEIRNARFLLADLTHHNRGAYWEGGYAEGLGKPVIYLCERSVFDDEKKRPHFDTNHCQTVVWEEENPKECARQLKATIRVTLPGEAKQTDD
ncbi:MAG: hypothetical protein ACU0DI_05710 [Paracoccaceae bacterium]